MGKRFRFSGPLLALAVVLSAGFSDGSTITSVSPSSFPAAANGTSYNVTQGSYSVDGNGMAGIVITATFSGGSGATSQQCTWASASCSVSNQFSVSFPGSTDTDPAAGSLASSIWTVTNSRTSGNLLSLNIQGLPGLIAFDLCTTKTGSNPIALDNTDSPGGGTCFGDNAVEDTSGSNVGYSAHSASGGTTSATASAVYSNELHVGATPANGDIWGTLTLTFGGSSFASGKTPTAVLHFLIATPLAVHYP